MSGLTQAVRSFRNIWSHGDEEFQDDEADYNDEPATPPASQAASRPANTSYAPQPAYGGSGTTGSGVKRLRSVAPSPLRAREKNIYTLRPKTQEDAAIAADALKAGDAVIINLEELDRSKAVRIIDFMSGVCYGLEGQGHAMKLGDLIFLYTPPEFEITSDETDYGENPDFFFRDVEHPKNASSQSSATAATSSVATSPVNASLTAARDALRASQQNSMPPSSAGIPAPASQVGQPQGQPLPSQTLPQQSFSPQSYNSAERRPWER